MLVVRQENNTVNVKVEKQEEEGALFKVDVIVTV